MYTERLYVQEPNVQLETGHCQHSCMYPNQPPSMLIYSHQVAYGLTPSTLPQPNHSNHCTYNVMITYYLLVRTYMYNNIIIHMYAYANDNYAINTLYSK